MKFKLNTQIDYWEATAELFDRELCIRLESDHAEDEREEVALRAIKKITTNWKRLQKVIADSLHKIYNEAWAEPDEGLPRLTRREFLEHLELRTADVYHDHSLSLHFSVGDLFAGHSIDVFWTEDDAICKASLVG